MKMYEFIKAPTIKMISIFNAAYLILHIHYIKITAYSLTYLLFLHICKSHIMKITYCIPHFISLRTIRKTWMILSKIFFFGLGNYSKARKGRKSQRWMEPSCLEERGANSRDHQVGRKNSPGVKYELNFVPVLWGSNKMSRWKCLEVSWEWNEIQLNRNKDLWLPCIEW